MTRRVRRTLETSETPLVPERIRKVLKMDGLPDGT